MTKKKDAPHYSPMRCTSVGLSLVVLVVSLHGVLSKNARAETLTVQETFENYPSQSVISVTKGMIVDMAQYPYWVPTSGTRSVYAQNGEIGLAFRSTPLHRVIRAGFNHIINVSNQNADTTYGSCPVVISVTAYIPGPNGIRLETRSSPGGPFNFSVTEPGESIGGLFLSNWLGGQNCLPIIDNAVATVEILHPDLSIKSVALSRDGVPPSDMDGDGTLDLASGAQYRARIEIDKVDIPIDIDSVSVKLNTGVGTISKTLNPHVETSVDIDFIASGDGPTELIASVEPTIGEVNLSNNEHRISVSIESKLRIVLTPIDGKLIQGQGPKIVQVFPSFKACGKVKTDTLYTPRIRVRCFDEITQEFIEGCSFAVSLSEGPYTGGHSDTLHPTERPLGKPIPSTVQSSWVQIPKDGYLFRYETPEVSGEVDLKFLGIDSAQARIKPAKLRFQVKVPDLVPLSVPPIEGKNWMEFDVSSHYSGTYGSQSLYEYLPLIIQTYRKKLDIPGFSLQDASPIESEGANLPWGGLFDYKTNWHPPHCTHRNGAFIDLSIGFVSSIGRVMTKRERKALEDALRANKAFFSQTLEGNHWHVKVISE